MQSASGLPQCVIVGRDIAFTYAKLEEAVRCVDLGARLIVANPDVSHPGKGGRRVPETGALAAAIIAVVGGTQVEYAGKPGASMLQLAMERCGSAPATTVMIGDNPSTDIAGARNVGMNAVWISDGRAGDGFTVTNIGELLKVVAR
ncbi:MAG TPA: HAD-IA family hydrolase [Paenibacillus sp.]